MSTMDETRAVNVPLHTRADRFHATEQRITSVLLCSDSPTGAVLDFSRYVIEQLWREGYYVFGFDFEGAADEATTEEDNMYEIMRVTIRVNCEFSEPSTLPARWSRVYEIMSECVCDFTVKEMRVA